MGGLNGKRSRVQKPEKSRKRQRVLQPGRIVLGSKVVAIDDLAWRAVALPDQFEDAEGFYGLEEIDDVEVVRSGEKVQYRVVTNGATEHETTGDIPDEIVWEGFDEDENKDNGLSRLESAAARVTSKKQDKKDKSRIASGKMSSSTNGILPRTTPASGFSALEDAEEEDIDVSAWMPLGLSAYTLGALSKLKFARPTPIQEATIPAILSGENVIGKASTGSGKTLAFGLPIVESILKSHKSKVMEDKHPVALILSPTRELAHQISQHIIDVCINLTVDSPRVATLTGGLAIQKQERLLAKADIVIGTPGRVWEIMSTVPGAMTQMKKVEYLVVDEADRLLSEGHFKEVEQILDALDKEEIHEASSPDGSNIHSNKKRKRQTLVFSATFQKDLQRKLAGRNKSSNNMLSNKESLDYLLQKLNFSSEPKFIDVNPIKQMATNLREGLLECGAMEKDLYLYTVLLLYPKERSLIFTNSISSVRRLTPLLQNLNLQPIALHSEMPQKARLRSIERFSSMNSTGAILIATDVAARGLDIPSVDLIVHYHVPRAADTYVHRSGRTARAGESGTSIMLCAPEEIIPVQRLVAKIHATGKAGSKKPSLRKLSVDRTLVNRLKPRITLAATLVSASSSKAKTSSEESWLRKAADDLGIDYDSEEFAAAETEAKGRGRGKGRKRATREEAEGTSKQQLAAWRAELRDLLNKRINLGVSEKYLSAGGVDMDRLLAEKEHGSGGRAGGEFLGIHEGITGWD